MSRKTDEVVIPSQPDVPIDPIGEFKTMIRLRNQSDQFLFVASEHRYQPVDTDQFRLFLQTD